MTDVPFTGKSLLAKLTSNSILAVSNSGSGFRWEPTNLTVADLNRALVGISGTTILADTNFSDQLIIFGASTFNITLPTAVANDGQIIESYDLIGSVGAHTFITTGGQTIDGNASRTIAAGEYISFVAYGGQWFTLISNVNPYTDAEKTKLNGIETLATADQTDSEIETAYNNQVAAASQVQMETGTEPSILRMSPLRVAQAIAALAVGEMSGPASSTDNEIARQNGTSGKIIQSYTSNPPIIGDDGEVTLAAILTKTVDSSIVDFVSYGANQDNYVFTSSHILWNSTTAIDLTGLVPIGANSNVVTITLRNGSAPLTLVDNATSTASNRIQVVGSFGDFTLLIGGDSVTLKYDNSLLRWRITASNRAPVIVTADSNSGQSLTSIVTLIEYEDNIIDPHGAWSGDNTFTAPRDGTYICRMTYDSTTAGTEAALLYLDSVNTSFGGMSNEALLPAQFCEPLRLDKGQTVEWRSSSSRTRGTQANKNRMSIMEVV